MESGRANYQILKKLFLIITDLGESLAHMHQAKITTYCFY
ncbi:Uncharacterized protein dnm_095410 [Desulfonema magnum]|uniref:Uncharacterized protein n=1 Tax=Desulfonema magnum TaxID=45655 RepID=A0A975BXG0_9BACT|nr:Uncharacterized protein dnm_095410 [Desulfonema magnum]